jgi:hypothetical protein
MSTMKSLPVHSSLLFLKVFRMLYYRNVILENGRVTAFDIIFEVFLNSILAYSVITLQSDLNLRTFLIYYCFDTVFFIASMLMYVTYIEQSNASSSFEAFQENANAQRTLDELKTKGAPLPLNVEVKPKFARMHYIDIRIVQIIIMVPIYLLMIDV